MERNAFNHYLFTLEVLPIRLKLFPNSSYNSRGYLVTSSVSFFFFVASHIEDTWWVPRSEFKNFQILVIKSICLEI